MGSLAGKSRVMQVYSFSFAQPAIVSSSVIQTALFRDHSGGAVAPAGQASTLVPAIRKEEPL